MAVVTASATVPGLDCHVPRPMEGILAPVLSSKEDKESSAIVEVVNLRDLWSLESGETVLSRVNNTHNI